MAVADNTFSKEERLSDCHAKLVKTQTVIDVDFGSEKTCV